MFNLNRITLIGNTGGEAKTVANGPTTLSLATNVSWTDKQTNERRTRTEWHQLVMWNSLGKWAATLPKGTPLYVEGELVYEKYPRKVEATLGQEDGRSGSGHNRSQDQSRSLDPIGFRIWGE